MEMNSESSPSYSCAKEKDRVLLAKTILPSSLANLIDQHVLNFFFFLLVGLITAFFYLGIFALLWKIMDMNYHVAVSIAYVVSIVIYFFTHRHVTFKNTNNAIKQQLPKFIAMILFNYIITITVVHISVEVFSLQPYFGTVIAIGANTLSNYFIAKLWVFKHS